jgi:hypothetical protein
MSSPSRNGHESPVDGLSLHHHYAFDNTGPGCACKRSPNLMTELASARLRLRQWCAADAAPFAALHADPEIMQFLAGHLRASAAVRRGMRGGDGEAAQARSAAEPVIEHNRAGIPLINRGFTRLNKMARASARDPRIRAMRVLRPLEYFLGAPKAHALALKRLSSVAQGYLESLCE